MTATPTKRMSALNKTLKSTANVIKTNLLRYTLNRNQIKKLSPKKEFIRLWYSQIMSN